MGSTGRYFYFSSGAPRVLCRGELSELRHQDLPPLYLADRYEQLRKGALRVLPTHRLSYV